MVSSPFRMYLRFRKFDSKKRAPDHSAFAKAYEMIHGKAAPIGKTEGDVRIQINLVKCCWVRGKPKQKHIAVIGTIRQGDEPLEAIRKRLTELKVGKEPKHKLLSKISDYVKSM